ncbi:uncharacterized protein J8A68_002591 [[Candida] subhashii]|uniref:ATP-dependent (S)-NAD(P)H-hydrate dehydratase n=1 Tax=[Candida] subhashii TaxID=561895 RepID=A0A8J5UIU7_9ASCO|nr:uncharacterized protein J8A68_002591 [[Candida] subhashii]KAG7663903.1 hypothetical protein J8A68_002591 [[Candida] subhashii]
MLRNRSHKELINLSRQLIQPLLPHFHKGQAGRVTVIGGNEDYTGAPFFASHSAAIVGADLSHVICEKLAAPIIKSYSPDLMIHPYLFDLDNPAIELNKSDIEQFKSAQLKDVIVENNKLDIIIDEIILPKVSQLLSRTDIVVVGPGFGRDPLMLKSLVRIIEEIKVLNKSIILDADSLYLISIHPEVIQNYTKAIITPNVVEFDRIAKELGMEPSINESNLDTLISRTQEMSKNLGNIIVIRKGKSEIIANSERYLVNDFPGSSKRVGGQGDSLTGAIATFVNWSNNYNEELWDVSSSGDKKIPLNESNLLACYAASTLVRCAGGKAFRKYGRAMQTSNLHEFLGESFNELFEDAKPNM